jgi:membrane protease YdiL (CAAX protease family)
MPAVLGKEGLGIVQADIPFQPGVLAASILGLTGIAFLVTTIADGKPGIRSLLRRFYAFRTGPQWYLVAVCLVPALLLVVSLAMHGAAALSPFVSHAPQLLTVYLLNVVTIAILINLFEEGGWMGFVTDRLQRQWGPLRACLVVGPLMGAIHLPLFTIAGAVTTNGGRVQVKDLPLTLFVLLIGYGIPFRIILTWAYNSSGRSLPIVALLHSSFDQVAAATILGTFFLGLDSVWINIVPTPVALAIVLFTRGRLGYKPEPPVSPDVHPTSMAPAVSR